MGTEAFDIYWAAPLFSAAEQAFNAIGAEILRSDGRSVFLPQEHASNAPTASPKPIEIFVSDTAPLLSSRVMVAVIDGETIDSGVACEIGLAHQNSIPIVALYTDFRQHRVGPGHMYRNLFVLGAIERNGVIVSQIKDVASAVTEMLNLDDFAEGADGAAPARLHDPRSFNDFISRLEGWYEPRWSIQEDVAAHIDRRENIRLLDFGCGVGRLADELLPRLPSLHYVGYDHDPIAIEVAASQGHPRATFFNDLDRLRQDAGSAFDFVVMAFVLHDHPLADAEELVRTAFDLVGRDGTLRLIDLTTWDLPRTTQLLRRAAAGSHGEDWRLDAERIGRLCQAVGSAPLAPELLTHTISFPTQSDLSEYCTQFRVSSGADLPLGLSATQESVDPIKELTREVFPLVDWRSFAAINLPGRH